MMKTTYRIPEWAVPSRVFQDDPFEFAAQHRPVFPGSPARPPHPRGRRFVYGVVGLLLGLAAGFGNALVLTNTSYLLGALGADSVEVAWIPTAYVMTFSTMNLLAVKFRQQFGLRLFAMLGLIVFCAVTGTHLVAGGLVEAIWIHALAGVAAAPLLTLTVYYLMAALPPAKALNAAVGGLALSQVATPLARLFPGDDFIHDQWITLYTFELGLAMLCLAAVGLVRLPPSEKEGGFELLDVLSYPFLAIGLALLTAVLGLGRYEWWTDREWLGWCLAAAIPVLLFAILFESCRSRPLLEVRWLSAEGLLRFALVVICLRIVLAQQQTVAFGLLGNAGILSANVRLFSAMLVGSALFGTIVVMLVIKPTNVLYVAAAGLALIGVAAFMESFATNLTRTPELLATQALTSFATALAVGPSIGVGLGKVIKSGGKYLASFLVLLSVTQNLGGLAGATLLGSYQVIREKANSVALVERAPAFDAAVHARIAQGGGGLAGASALQKAMTREANVLAYNNTSMLVAILAMITALYLVGRGVYEGRLVSRP